MDTPLLPKAYRVVNPPFNLRVCQGQVYQVVARTDQYVHLNVAGLTRWFYLHEVEPVVTCRRRASL